MEICTVPELLVLWSCAVSTQRFRSLLLNCVVVSLVEFPVASAYCSTDPAMAFLHDFVIILSTSFALVW
jgi:hypothetical protein